jgi:hypothetical protein
MAPNPPIMQPQIMKAVERLGYRVTVGDVATQAGVNVNLAQQGLLALASAAGGHLQVAESGEVVYEFPKDFRDILRNKYFQLQIQEWWDKVWRVLFYGIRISFGIALLVSIALIALAIIAIMIGLSASRGDDNNDGGGDWGGDGGMFMPGFWFPMDFFWIFSPDPYDRYDERRRSHPQEKSEFNFLESVFSFLFGDGNPNEDLSDRRWRVIGNVIRNNQGAVTAEQIAPYLDELGTGYALEYEEYMLPVLTRFNGRPEVSPEGDLVYHFPELQATVTEGRFQAVSAYLKEIRWEFSRASSGQKMMAIALGGVNLVGALALGKLLSGIGAVGGLVGFVGAIYGLLLLYGLGFLAIPLARYFWIQWRNGAIDTRNDQRQLRAEQLNHGSPELHRKLGFAKQFAAETVIRDQDVIYSSDRDLLEQDVEQKDRLDAEWQRRLDAE